MLGGGTETSIVSAHSEVNVGRGDGNKYRKCTFGSDKGSL